jgi:hypothetical protein
MHMLSGRGMSLTRAGSLVDERNRQMQQRAESLEETAQTASRRLLETQQDKCTVSAARQGAGTSS